MRREKQIYKVGPKHLERLTVTAIAIFAVVAAVFAKALLLGELDWMDV